MKITITSIKAMGGTNEPFNHIPGYLVTLSNGKLWAIYFEDKRLRDYGLGSKGCIFPIREQRLAGSVWLNYMGIGDFIRINSEVEAFALILKKANKAPE